MHNRKPVTKVAGMRKKSKKSTNEKYIIMRTIRNMNMDSLNADRLTLIKNDKTSVDIYYPSVKILKNMIIIHDNPYTTVKGNQKNNDINILEYIHMEVDHDIRIQQILDTTEHIIMSDVNHIDFGSLKYRHLISNPKVFKFVKYGIYIVYGDVLKVDNTIDECIIDEDKTIDIVSD